MLPHSSSTKKKQFKVQMHFIPWMSKCNILLKDKNDISEEDVTSSYYYNDSSIEFDAIMIVGHNEGLSNGSLLLCRFHKLSPL